MKKYFKEKLTMQNDNTDLIKTGLSFPDGFWGKELEGLRTLGSCDPQRVA
jgi:hypothetical protein